MPISGTFTVGQDGNRVDKIWGTQSAADDASPTHHVRPGLPPFLLFAGDQSVEKERTDLSKKFVEQLKGKAIEAGFLQIPDRDHSTIVTKLGTPGDLLAERMLKFIHDHGAAK